MQARPRVVLEFRQMLRPAATLKMFKIILHHVQPQLRCNSDEDIRSAFETSWTKAQIITIAMIADLY